MEKIFENKSWNSFLINCVLLATTYAILVIQISLYHQNFYYKWKEKHIYEDSSFKIYSSYKIKRKSFLKTYYLEIYKEDQLFYKDECALSLERYCESLLERGGLPIKNLKYKEGVSPSNNIIYSIRSFEIIHNGENKKIDYSSVMDTPKKQNNIFFIMVAILLCLAVHIWILRKWFLTKKKDFTEAKQLEYWITKIGLPLSVVVAFSLFFYELQTILG
ncbi:hypothetical protein [Acinetobacter haemolyticus]|uniref:hypothetical protein n=1 Tax=Acinetobacter haemolyticus TaxID=29430 RepID=UPI0021CDC88E|nr:hypothetical protein [Acinetobacter haemolyticus]MCU4378343.1 hypothetical protein [Acinetobacter haemolyticus]